MFAAPAEGTLKDFMEFAETGFADHEQSPPNQRTHATEHYAELINRNRRYGRFRHASSLPKPTRTPSNLTPRNLPLSLVALNSNKGTKSLTGPARHPIPATRCALIRPAHDGGRRTPRHQTD